MKTLALGLALGLAALGSALAETPQSYRTQFLGTPEMIRPAGAPTALIFLLSDAEGWGDDERIMARSLAAEGALVLGVDLPSWRARIEPGDGCAYLVSDIEGLAQSVQRDLKVGSYLSPVVAGRGAGGAMALAIAAQTPDATVGRTVAVDPPLAVPLTRTLCSEAPRREVEGGTVYGFRPGKLPNPVDVFLTPAAPEGSRAHLEELIRGGHGVSLETAAGTADEVLTSDLKSLIGPSTSDESVASLPVVPLPADPESDTMAVVISGDGGWRDLDKTIADIFETRGVPTVGLDALRYFWSEKTPEETAKDLARIIEAYGAEWGTRHVLLVGYSFGADVLPAVYGALPAEVRERVRQISLLALSRRASFEIRVTGWLGAENTEGRPVLPDLARIDPALIQCFHGEDEGDASLCPELAAKGGVEVIRTAGGHHFDGDYEALASRILDGARRRAQVAEAATIGRR
jgi:type IV secretory pathway VirJ component